MTIALHFGDCLEVMPSIADGSVDLILADLPYGTTASRWDVVIPFGPLWANYRRLLRPCGTAVFTASQPFTSMLVMSNREWFRYGLVWEKSKPTGFQHAKNKPLKAHEDVVVFSRGFANHATQSVARMTYNPQFGTGKPYRKIDRTPNVNGHSMHATSISNINHVGRLKESRGTRYPRSVLWFANPNNGSSHPTQKPVALMEYLIRTYSNAGDTVLDNAMGSGTTGIACLNMGRHFIGIERDPGYFEIARRRIEAREHATPLLDAMEASPCCGRF